MKRRTFGHFVAMALEAKAFEKPDHSSVVKISRSGSAAFCGGDQIDRRWGLAELGENGEKACSEISDTLREILYDGGHQKW